MTGLLAATAFVGVARADIAVTSNDGHTVLDAAGNQVAAAGKDTVSVIDLKGAPRVLATIDAPGSVVGPPMAVAVAPDESYAIVTGATRAEPSGQFGIAPDDKVSVIDLTVNPPRVVQSLTAGAGATTVRISPDGTLALVANRAAGTVSVFSIKDRRLTAAGTVMIDPKSMPSGLAFLPDGKTALLSRYGDHQVAVLRMDGTKVTIDKRPITTALSPYTLDITRDGKLAAVGNMGRGDGDADTVSLIDLSAEPFRTVQTLQVGRSPEGLKWSPDGRFLAIGSQNGTGKPADSPFYQPHGRLIMLALKGKTLAPVAEAPVGRWSQGIVFSRDGKTLLIEDMVERDILVLGWNGRSLTPKGKMTFPNGPAAIQTPWQ
jgi:DNA-binding beta-propeller fold protein YncE